MGIIVIQNRKWLQANIFHLHNIYYLTCDNKFPIDSNCCRGNMTILKNRALSCVTTANDLLFSNLGRLWPFQMVLATKLSLPNYMTYIFLQTPLGFITAPTVAMPRQRKTRHTKQLLSTRNKQLHGRPEVRRK